MTKRDKEKLKRLKKELKANEKKFDELRKAAGHAQDNMGTPPEPDDWLYAEEIAGYCREMENLNDRADEIQGMIEDLTNES